MTSSSTAIGSLAEALDRVGGHPRSGTWIRGTGWRDAAWPEKPTAAALDAVTGETPAALWSKDYHSLWLNTAGSRRGRAPDEPGGVVERDVDGSPTGILREESAWRFRDRYVTVTQDEFVDATREGIRLANARGVAASTTRTAGSARVDLPADPRPGGPHACGCGSRSPPTASHGSVSWAFAPASATTSSGSAT